LKSDGQGPAFIEAVFQPVQAELEQTQIAALAPVNDGLPPVLHDFGAEADHPVVGQTRRHQQPGQALRLAQMAMAQIKAPAFLVGEEGLDAETLLVPEAGFRKKVQARHQQKRLLLAPLPDRTHQNRAKALGRKQQVGYLHAVAGLQIQRRERERFVRPVRFAEKHIFGGAADIVPARALSASPRPECQPAP